MALNGRGSLINGLAAGYWPTKEAAGLPSIGDGATFYHWTDRSAATVTRIETSKSGKTTTVYVRGDEYTLSYPDGYVTADGYTPGTGREVPVRLRKYKRGWRWMSGSTVVHFGVRDAYRDPSF